MKLKKEFLSHNSDGEAYLIPAAGAERSTAVCSARYSDSLISNAHSLRRISRPIPRDRKRRCLPRQVSPPPLICIYGTNRSTISTCFPVCRSKNCCSNISRRCCSWSMMRHSETRSQLKWCSSDRKIPTVSFYHETIGIHCSA